MRVLLIATAVYSLEGGLERFNRRLVRSLDEIRGSRKLDEVKVLTLWDTPGTGTAAPDGVEFIAASSSRVRFVLKFLALLLRRRPDIVIFGHVHFSPLIALGRLFRRDSKQLLVVHGVEVWEEPPSLEGISVRRWVDRILAVSRYTARRMGERYGVEEDRFRILPNALDLPPEASAAPSAPAPRFEGRWRLLVVSRLSLLDTYKNVDKVILALPGIESVFPGTHCHVVGDGPWRGALEELARAGGVAARIHFHGYADEETKEALYASSHLLVLPSTGEGFGIVFLEAWRHRLPVVTANEGAAEEIVRNGLDGLCVPPRPEEIAAAVISLLGDPRRREEMGERGHRRLVDNFTHERFRERLAEILGDVSRCAA
jgi:glycosyltransferase involved in cell wall biosynthesis